jgi:hypothetical protein
MGVQVHTCVSVHCAQCGQALGSPGFEAHYISEDAALAAAEAAGWVEGPGGRWWCSACGPVLECEAEGHEFTPWQPQAARAYRYCRRCCRHESRAEVGPSDLFAACLVSGVPHQGKAPVTPAVAPAGTEGTEEEEVA